MFRPVAKVLARWTENRRGVRYSLLALNVLMLGAISLFVVRGPAESSAVASGQMAASQAGVSNPLDQLSSAEIAINASLAAGLAQTVAVINQADSEASRSAFASTDAAVVSKQQAVATAFKSAADIQEYTVKEGDTLAAIAARFDITSDSIIWSNDLSGSNVEPGQTLLIPPVNGVVYTVQSGDTPESLASRYGANLDQLIAFNDIELTGSLGQGQRIVIPGGSPPAPPQPTAPARLTARFGYNGYDYGYCTWYVAERRSVPVGLGNASTWAVRARAMGMLVNSSPAAGAAVQTSASGLGHVAYVEEVLPDGSIWISEMNSRGQRHKNDSTPAGGWGVVNWKHIPAGQARSYSYIH